jgi:undecaprenyl-diphosphatase
MCTDDDVWVIDFGFSEVAASDALLQHDVAEFLCSSAVIVGPARAVDNAVAVLGADVVAEAIPWIQPLAVSSATRAALSKAEFEDLRERVRAASGTSAPELPQLQRVSWKGVAITVALGVAVWTLLPQLTSGIDWGAALRADRGRIAAALVASAMTYVGAAISVSGSVTEKVPLVPTFFAQLASSFTNRVTPAKVGGLALNLRLLSKQGVDNTFAATGLAVSTAAGTVVHVLITVIVVLWAGNVGFPGVSAPPTWLLVAIVAVLLLGVLAVAVLPVGRRWWVHSVVPSLRRSYRSFVEVIRSPQHLVMLFGGSALVTISNLVAFYVSIRAFGIDVPFATVGVVYLAGSALASAAPTPGGLGATEAALVAGLAVVGVEENQAVPAVLLFRLATFWIPILPGWISLTVLQRRGDL